MGIYEWGQRGGAVTVAVWMQGESGVAREWTALILLRCKYWCHAYCRDILLWQGMLATRPSQLTSLPACTRASTPIMLVWWVLSPNGPLASSYGAMVGASTSLFRYKTSNNFRYLLPPQKPTASCTFPVCQE